MKLLALFLVCLDLHASEEPSFSDLEISISASELVQVAKIGNISPSSSSDEVSELAVIRQIERSVGSFLQFCDTHIGAEDVCGDILINALPVRVSLSNPGESFRLHAGKLIDIISIVIDVNMPLGETLNRVLNGHRHRLLHKNLTPQDIDAITLEVVNFDYASEDCGVFVSSRVDPTIFGASARALGLTPEVLSRAYYKQVSISIRDRGQRA